MLSFDFTALNGDGEECPVFINNLVIYKNEVMRVVEREWNHWENDQKILTLSSVLNPDCWDEGDSWVKASVKDVVKVSSEEYLNVYKVSRAYGGPEEGGWWYDAGYPVSSIRLRSCESVNKINELVAYIESCQDDDGGKEFSIVIEEHFATPYPKERPYYC